MRDSVRAWIDSWSSSSEILRKSGRARQHQAMNARVSKSERIRAWAYSGTAGAGMMGARGGQADDVSCWRVAGVDRLRAMGRVEG